MNIEVLNPYVIKILISVRKKDSISSISQRIGVSYGWTHKWVKELIKEGILKEKWRGLALQENNKSYQAILKFVKNNVSETGLYYTAINLFGIDYSFTKTDAVYIWVEGKYNIARYKEFYPIFIKIKTGDYPLFEWYCKKLGLKINAKKGAFYVPEKVTKIASVKKDDYRVDSLNETIAFMKDNIYNFEPALEMIDEMYKKGLHITYKEMNTL
jgi:DNA-binding Lrp family transcriptional regulator